MAVAAEVEEDRPLDALLVGARRLLRDGVDRVRRLGRRHDALAAREAHRLGEALVLGVRLGSDSPRCTRCEISGAMPW